MVVVLTKTGNKRGDTDMEEKMLVGTSKSNPVGFPVRYVSVETRRDGKARGTNDGISKP